MMASMPAFMSSPEACEDLIAKHHPLTHDACLPVPMPIFDLIEVVCIGIFTFDYLARILTVHAVSPSEAGIQLRKDSQAS
jgi:hypothetical protein